MNKLQKITVNKSDEASLVVEKIIDAEANEIVLSIPRFSKLGDSLSNFHLIRREAELLNKKIVIESVDDKVIELAALAKLEALNPFFIKSRRQFSDIVMSSKKADPALESGLSAGTLPTPILKPKKHSKTQRATLDLSRARLRMPNLPSVKKTIVLFGLAAIIIAGLFLVVTVLPRAEIVIVNKKYDWSYNNSVTVDKLISKVDASATRIPGQVFSQIQSLRLNFPATAKKLVETRASGTITIYNAYSSSPQTLVATTRFLTSDGKVFRLAESVVVPGAQIVEGKIVPSGIDVKVVADKPGESYNIGLVGKFTIPGFKGTPKYAAFYGESKTPMSGGFIGEVKYPSDDDIKNAKSGWAKQLEDSLALYLTQQIPKEFTWIKNFYDVLLGKPAIITEVDSAGNFAIDGNATIRLIAFREVDLKEAMLQKMRKDHGEDFKFQSFKLSYGEPRADFVRGILSFPVQWSSQAVRYLDIDGLRKKLANKSESDLKVALFSLPGLESAKISLWPFWVRKAPGDINKIKITID